MRSSSTRSRTSTPAASPCSTTWANLAYLKFDEFDFGDLVYPAKGKTRITILHTNSMGVYSKTKYPDEAGASSPR